VKKWRVQVIGSTKHWECDVEAETRDAASEAGVGRLRQEYQDYAGGMDVFAEPDTV